MPADLCVIIVSYNTCDLTLRCLRRVRASAPDAEIVVVDNASADGSPEAIFLEFPEVRLLRLAENVGWGRAVNRASLSTDADYLLLLNPDAEPVGDAIADLVAFARAHPRHGIYTGRTLGADGDDDGYSCLGIPTLWSGLTFATGLSTVFRRHQWANPDVLPGFDRRSVREVPVVSGAAMLIERRAFLRLRGFHPRLFMYSDDVELCDRAAELGYSPVFVPHVAVTHLLGASSNPVGQRVKLLRGGVTYLQLRWSPARARLGVALLTAGIAWRALATWAAKRARGRTPRGIDWVEVWRERAVWSAGWPPIDEPRPSLELAGERERATSGAADRDLG